MAPALADPPAPRPSRWGDLSKRVVSALVLAPCTLACMWAGGWWWTGLILLMAVGTAHEWRQMSRGRAGPGTMAFGALYIVIPAVALISLRGGDAVGRGNLLFVVFIVWASDIGAYLCGRLFGGPRLAPAISPGKTWSGAIGGLACAALIGLVAAVAAGLSPGRAMLVAAVLGAVAEAGDLLESAIKRHFGVKDSGRLIPGHGGLLDRLDGLMAAAPAAVLLAAALGQGIELWR